MGVAERRQREKADIRQRILDAARELFVQQGYDSVSMRKIAEKIEYTATAIYFHFKDKDDLCRALCADDFEKFAQAFLPLAKIKDPVDRLKRMGLTYVEFALQQPNQYRWMFMTPHPEHPEEIETGKGNPERDAYAMLKITVSECIEQKRFRREYRDADLVSQIVWAGIHGLVSLHIALGHDDWVDWRPVKQTAKAMVESQVRGLLAES